MTTTELHYMTGLSYRKIRYLCESGKIPAYKNIKGHWVIPVKEECLSKEELRELAISALTESQ